MSQHHAANHSAKGFNANKFLALVILAIMTLIMQLSIRTAAAEVSSCDGVTGQWTITNITAYRMTINANGTGGFHTGVTFKWTCHEDSFVYIDSMGFTWRMTISGDRMHMVGAGLMGERLTAVRDSPLVTAKAPLPPSTSNKSNRNPTGDAPKTVSARTPEGPFQGGWKVFGNTEIVRCIDMGSLQPNADNTIGYRYTTQRKGRQCGTGAQVHTAIAECSRLEMYRAAARIPGMTDISGPIAEGVEYICSHYSK